MTTRSSKWNRCSPLANPPIDPSIRTDDVLSVRDRLIGVIDLRGGLAVHAVAGKRSSYRVIERVAGAPVDGDPGQLAFHYLTLGVRRLYVADLDSIGGCPPDPSVIAKLAKFNFDEFLFDVGSGVLRICDLPIADDGRIGWVIATEAIADLDLISQTIDRVGVNRVWLGIDYHGGIFRKAANGTAETPSVAESWDDRQVLAYAAAEGVHQVVVIDTACVGTGDCGPGVAAVDRVSRHFDPGFPSRFRLVGGGGIRDRGDVLRFRGVGATACLIGTSLHNRSK